MKCSLGISNFLEEIASLFCSVVFLYFFALIAEEGLFISPCSGLVHWDDPEGWDGEGRWEGGSGWGAHVHPWRIQVNVLQKQYNIVK